ncbi:MAG: hypothetical protein JXR97_01510, partial [Planctomycetes bacterium]|nr:hypothetical protein [Planctomycetota bacterium]
VLRKIASWVREKGGRLLAVDRCRDLELEPVWEFDSLFGITPDSEDAWGHTGQSVNASADFPCIGAIKSIHAEHGWLGLAEGVEKIACAVERPGQSGTVIYPVSSLFRLKHGSGGEGIFYCGPLVLKRDPQALFADGGTFSALLSDVCAMSGVQPYGTQADEIARARIDGRLYALKDDGIHEL